MLRNIASATPSSTIYAAAPPALAERRRLRVAGERGDVLLVQAGGEGGVVPQALQGESPCSTPSAAGTAPAAADRTRPTPRRRSRRGAAPASDAGRRRAAVAG